jgi:hypothetical protein
MEDNPTLSTRACLSLTRIRIKAASYEADTAKGGYCWVELAVEMQAFNITSLTVVLDVVWSSFNQITLCKRPVSRSVLLLSHRPSILSRLIFVRRLEIVDRQNVILDIHRLCQRQLRTEGESGGPPRNRTEFCGASDHRNDHTCSRPIEKSFQQSFQFPRNSLSRQAIR